MSAMLLTLFLAAQGGAPAPAAAEPAAAKPTRKTELPAPVQEVVDRFNKASAVSRVIGGVVVASGATLLTVGLLAAVLAAGLRFSPAPASPSWEQEPRHTAGALSAAVAAGGLLLGSVMLLGGLVGAILG